MSTALAVRGLRCAYDGQVVVNDVSFSVEAGELLALVGPSGCGKSTLLRAIAGLEHADAGTVEVAGRDVTPLPPEVRRVGLVFQEHALFPHLRIDANVGFGLRHLPRRDRAARVAEMLHLVRLDDMGRRYPHELSGGEQQRVALARALAPQPDVVLLDEPFASLDEQLGDEMRAEVVEVLARLNTAAVLVTHDRDEALAVGHRVAVMRGGRLVQVGAPEEVYEHPADEFVAAFLATTALLRDGDEVLVARPHELAVLPGGPDTVLQRIYLGAVHRYRVRRADGSIVVAAQAPVRRLEPGEACTVEVATDHPLHRLHRSHQS